MNAPLTPTASATALLRLSELALGASGTVMGLAVSSELVHGVGAEELERRLLEMGFVEGARFEILHEGLFGRDPLALKLDDMRVGLRRREAQAILVTRDE